MNDQQRNRVFLLDVEASDKTPMSGKMTEFGIVHLGTGDGFYVKLYAAHPHPHIPALPVLDLDIDGDPIVEAGWNCDGMSNTSPTVYNVLHAAKNWVRARCTERPTMVSDNPGFDAMFFNCALDEEGIELVFGHSSRRIGDFSAGLSRKWGDTSSWKRLRKTAHTHDPLDDARGNAEALDELIRRAQLL